MKGRSIILKQYGTAQEALEIMMQEVPEPNEDEILIEIKAASVNPIDCRIRSGYGKTILGSIAPLPIVLGRDFSGVVRKVGKNVTDFKMDDEVWGVVSPGRPGGLKLGSHSECINILANECVKKPNNIDHIAAASLPYAALTTWSALIGPSDKLLEYYKGKKVLVHAGAGGVGTFAIQFLKQLGATVATTCSTDNVVFLQSLGADKVIDYKIYDYEKELPLGFDVVYDLLGKTHTNKSLNLLKSEPPSLEMRQEIEKVLDKFLAKLGLADDSYSFPAYRAILKEFDEEVGEILSPNISYVSIVGPMMSITDEKGFHVGMQQYITETLQRKTEQLCLHGRRFAYSLYEPNRSALEYIAKMVESGKVIPHVSSVFSIDEAIAAHEAVDTGHVRGKVVFNMGSYQKKCSNLEFIDTL